MKTRKKPIFKYFHLISFFCFCFFYFNLQLQVMRLCIRLLVLQQQAEFVGGVYFFEYHPQLAQRWQ